MTFVPWVVRLDHGHTGQSIGTVGNAAVLQATSAKASYGCDEVMLFMSSHCGMISARS